MRSVQASFAVRAVSFPVRAVSFPVRAVSCPVRAVSFPVRAVSFPVRAAWLCVLMCSAVSAQAPIDVKELSEYRLTAPVFERFVDASRRIADVVRQDASFAKAPLFTNEVTRSGDAAAAAGELISRLEGHDKLAAALGSAKITPRDYATFAITLIAAHLAHGFLESGVLRRVPDGAPATNVDFVRRHQSAVTDALKMIGVSLS